MEIAAFCRRTRVVIVAGKGGVGKTTVTAVLARMAGRAGVPTLIVELDGKSGLPGIFGLTGPFGYEEVELIPASIGDGDSGRAGTGGSDVGGSGAGDIEGGGAPVGKPATAAVRGRRLTPDDALLEYLQDHSLGRISKRLVQTGALDVVATAVPGLRDILVLGKIKQLERSGVEGLIVVDAPATGHALAALSTPAGLADAVSVGPIRVQAEDVIGLLSDKERSQVMMVTLPEETPVNEVTETAYRIEDTIGVNLGPVIVNGVYPDIAGLDVDPVEAASSSGVTLKDAEAEALSSAARFRRARRALQEEQLARLRETLPLPQLRLPHLFTTEIGFAEIDAMATVLASQVEEMQG